MQNNNSGWTSKPIAEIEYGSTQWVIERDKRLAAWEASKTALEAAKASEMELRKAFVDFSFDPTKKEGTERIELHNGFEAKAVKKLNWSLVSPIEGISVPDAVESALDRIEAIGEVGKFIASRLVKWTPELSKSEYNKLAEIPEGGKIKEIIDTVIQTKEGAPTLEIIQPKGKR